MAIAQSRVTSQGQISIPVEIRRRLGIVKGSILEWDQVGEDVIVRRAGKYTFADMHRILFPHGPPKRRTLKELNEGAAKYVREQHARGRY